MGVAGLWDVLRPAGKPRSLTHLSVTDGFVANPNRVRGFRVGIDASIWFYHATYGREGENPELRTLFFRCARLMSMPFLPLFVFDGPKRPKVKRGKRISGKDHWMVQGMQRIIDGFGFQWRMAPGEAEAELAYLNRIGVLDAVLSDDVDTFLFGATMVIRNPSATLSGNKAHPIKNSSGKTDDQHVITYSSSDFLADPSISLDQAGLILIGILRGGDYHQGLSGCGVTSAHGLAKCGFGESLVTSARTLKEEELKRWLVEWRRDVCQELKTNSKGHLGRKCPSLAKSIGDDFPDIEVLLSYTNPITSETYGRTKEDFEIDWEKEPDLGKIARVCEMYFEWGVKETIIKRFRTVIWPPAVLRILRRSALIADRKTKANGHDDRDEVRRTSPVPSTPKKAKRKDLMAFGTPSKMIAHHFSSLQLDTKDFRTDKHDLDSDSDFDGAEDNLIKKIHSSRTHASTDGVLEYRLEVSPAQLVRLCEKGIQGDRKPVENNADEFISEGDDNEEEDGEINRRGVRGKKPPPEPISNLRVWMPACMVKIAEPKLVEDFEAREQVKRDKKAGKGMKCKEVPNTKAKKALATLQLDDLSDNDVPVAGPSKPRARKVVNKTKVVAQVNESAPKSQVVTTKAQPVSMDKFFKSSKMGPIAKSAKSKTASVTALFQESNSQASSKRHADSPGQNLFNDSDEDIFGSSLSKGTKVSSSKAAQKRPSPPSKPKTASVLSLLDQPIASMEEKRARSQPVLQRAKARPFPIPLDPVPGTRGRSPTPPPKANTAAAYLGSPYRRRRGSISSNPDVDVVPLQKSPRKLDKGSPRSKGIEAYYSGEGEEDKLRSSSPSPYRSKTLPALFARSKSAASKSTTARAEIIEISSDSDDDLIPLSKQPLARPMFRKAATIPSIPEPTKRQIPPTREIIDLT